MLPTERIFQGSDRPTYRGLGLRVLAESPDAFGSTLEAEQRCTDDQGRERLAAGLVSGLDLPLCGEVIGQPVGLVWVKA